MSWPVALPTSTRPCSAAAPWPHQRPKANALATAARRLEPQAFGVLAGAPMTLPRRAPPERAAALSPRVAHSPGAAKRAQRVVQCLHVVVRHDAGLSLLLALVDAGDVIIDSGSPRTPLPFRHAPQSRGCRSAKHGCRHAEVHHVGVALVA